MHNKLQLPWHNRTWRAEKQQELRPLTQAGIFYEVTNLGQEIIGYRQQLSADF